MRLPDNHKWAVALVAAALAPAPAVAGPVNGPAADFPVVLGETYVAGGTTFTPVDSMNFDAVGYAAVSTGSGTLISAAHHTLPIPSYVEVTSLDTGRTILVRVDRRGPMGSADLIELSGPAAAQLGVGEHASVRVRRVNPPESERALLRAGGQAPERMATPKALLAVLTRRLDANATVSLARSATSPAAPAVSNSTASPQAHAAATPATTGAHVHTAFKAGFAGLEAPLAVPRPAAPTTKIDDPSNRQDPSKPLAKPVVKAAAPSKPPRGSLKPDALVIQAGAFAVKGNAELAAAKLGASVQPVGKLWRVRMGPFDSRVQADAALAKAHAAGYSQARIQHAE